MLSWALLGPPAAWIVGMPVIGATGEASWRHGWLALPVLGALLALAATAARAPRRSSCPETATPSGLRRALWEPGAARWLGGELMANSAWTGTLVYAGAVFTEAHGISPGATGLLLAVVGAAYVVGNVTFRRRVAAEPDALLVRLALGLALLVAAFGALRSAVALSAALLAAAAFLAGARTLVGIAVGIRFAAEHRLPLLAARSATLQVGYLVGAATAGGALALGGYGALGVALGGLFVAAALPHLRSGDPAASAASRRAPVTAPASAPSSVT